MGKALMVLVAGFVLASAYYNTGRTDAVMDSSSRVSDHQYEVLARQAALKGYEITKQNLSSSFSNGTVSGSYEGGTYSSSVTVTGSTAAITSVGSMTSTDGSATEYTVRASYEQNYVLPETPPTFMDFALLTEEDLTLNGDILGEVMVTGDDASLLNANMHTNGNMHIKGNSVSVKGFGTYTGSGSASPSRALLNSFTPEYNPTNLATAHHAGRVELPTFNVAAYLAKVSPDATDSGAIISGNYTLGTREHPYVWYINGNLTTVGDANIEGYALILVNGNIDLSGNLIAGNAGYDGPDESSVAFYSSGDIRLGGNVTIYGQMYAAGDLNLHGTPKIYGSLTTAGTATISGTPDIYYRRASPALTTIWQDPEVLSKLASYSEF